MKEKCKNQKKKKKRKTNKEQGFYPNSFKFCAAKKNYFYHLKLYNL